MKLFVFNKYIFNIVAILLLSTLPTTLFAEEVLYYHTDNFGTPMAMTDTTGKVVWRADELPFGEEYQTEELPARNDRRFLGKELDRETGLICMGARYLDPKTGRFNRPDPVGLVDPATGKVNQEMLADPQRQNRYIYGLNNPYKYIDPDGNFPILGATLIGAGIAYFSSPDVANAPASSSSPTYESHGERSIAAGAVGGAGLRGVGSVLRSKKLTTQQIKGIHSLKKRITEHENKLQNFRKNPTVRPGMENLSKDVIKKQQQRRLNHLQKEIKTFKKNIKKIKRGEL